MPTFRTFLDADWVLNIDPYKFFSGILLIVAGIALYNLTITNKRLKK